MIAMFLSGSVKCPAEGWFRHFVIFDGVTLATWVLAVFALIPLWALTNSINSKKRDDQFRLIQWLDAQFNSVGMLSARRETGKKVLSRDVIHEMKQFVPTSGWPIVTFFDRVAVLWSQGRLALGDIDIAYREYVFMIWASFGKHISDDLLQGQYKQLAKLRDALQRMDKSRQADDLAVAISHVKTEFWRRESEL